MAGADSALRVQAVASGGLAVECAADVDGRGDQAEVREGLWKISQSLAGQADLLRVEPEVVGVAEHLLEGQPGLVEAPGAGEGLGQPERTDREGPLVAVEPVGRDARVVPAD